MTSFSDMLSFLKTKFQEVYTYVSNAITQAITDHNTAVSAHSNGFNHDVVLAKSSATFGSHISNAGALVVKDKSGKYITSIISEIDTVNRPRLNFNIGNSDGSGTQNVMCCGVRQNGIDRFVHVQDYFEIVRGKNEGSDPFLNFINTTAVIPTASGGLSNNYGQIRFYGKKGSTDGDTWPRMGFDCDESVVTVDSVKYKLLQLQWHVFSYSEGKDLGETFGIGTKPALKLMIYLPLTGESRNNCFVRIQAVRFNEGTGGKYYDIFNGFKSNPLG